MAGEALKNTKPHISTRNSLARRISSARVSPHILMRRHNHSLMPRLSAIAVRPDPDRILRNRAADYQNIGTGGNGGFGRHHAFLVVLGAPAGRMPGTTRLKFGPISRRSNSTSSAEHTTPSMPFWPPQPAATPARAACRYADIVQISVRQAGQNRYGQHFGAYVLPHAAHPRRGGGSHHFCPRRHAHSNRPVPAAPACAPPRQRCLEYHAVSNPEIYSDRSPPTLIAGPPMRIEKLLADFQPADMRPNCCASWPAHQFRARQWRNRQGFLSSEDFLPIIPSGFRMIVQHG